MGINENVLDIISKVLDVQKDEITLDEPLKGSLGVDSTEMVEILIAINKGLGLDLKQGDIANSDSPNQIIAIIEKRKQAV